MASTQDLLWLLAIGIGGLAAWMDWRKHAVENWVWILGFALASPLLVIELFQEPVVALIRWACFLGFALAVFALWRFGAFGAADGKGFTFFALVLSPVGYFDVWHGKVYPALDVLVTSMVLAEVLRRVMKKGVLPFFTVSFAPLLLAPVAGGLFWWPIMGLLQWLL